MSVKMPQRNTKTTCILKAINKNDVEKTIQNDIYIKWVLPKFPILIFKDMKLSQLAPQLSDKKPGEARNTSYILTEQPKEPNSGCSFC